MNLNENTLRDKVLELLSNAMAKKNMDPSELTDEVNFLEKGLLDSVAFLEFITKLESGLGVQIDFMANDPAEMSSLAGLKKILIHS